MFEFGRRWWRQTEQFDWFSVYLRDRGLQSQWQVSICVVTLMLAALPLVMLGTPVGPDTAATRAVCVGAGVGGVLAATVWLGRWPTRRQSMLYHGLCCLSIAAGCLSLSNPYPGLIGCTLFTALGGLLAYFHSVVHVLANFGVAMSCAAITATRLALDTGDIPLVVASLLVVTTLNFGVPFGIQSLVHSLRTDLLNSEHDPLTGLPNRRAFHNAVYELLQRKATGQVNVTMIDLDHFKRLNDTRGHVFGDQALAGVAAVLRDHTASDGVLGRLGGEEFVIADTLPPDAHAAVAERVRSGIAALPFDITASLGTCSSSVVAGDCRRESGFIDRLLHDADSAMYQAKRAGGDRVHPRIA